eukprot:TRINITY_DN1276_c0_g1_i1.p1 TRINITY_DN1276_c0_g1~~TRINITY_DN1276_c0_g1_i1.p1  ORF type:complete len:159 (-),score=26.13 TRINITY_DN1276_c0_g1_i1:118-594(-)
MCIRDRYMGYMATQEEKNDLLKIFSAFDKNGDGLLSKEELIEGYQRLLNVSNAEEEVQKIMDAVDSNKSGVIDYTEFVTASINRQKMLTKKRLEAVFKIFDKDGNGSITPQELKAILGSQSNQLNNELLDQIIGEVDENNDGEISYKEFKEMMFKMLH